MLSFFRISLFLMVFFSVFTAKGETEITGVVTNSSGKSLPSVIVKAISGDSREWHTRTGKEGRFSLVIPDCPDTLTLRFSKLGYETESMIVTDYATPISAQLLPASSTLREVTVTAPEVRLKGDTIIYNLADFAGKGDVTLQDALKKVPGIEVEDNGGIKYNGKSISNFYINGMDLLGGKYNLATTGIPHSYVSAVEILNNHQNKKIDRKIFSDNVALNIKLKKKAMFKPMGKYVVKAGTGSKWMGEAAGAGMMFRDDFQTILTLKGGNVNEFASYDNMVHYHYDKNGSGGSYAEKIMGNLSSSSPPLERSRWIKPTDVSTTLNFINKLSDDATIRTNISYEYAHSDYLYSESASYYDGDSDLEIVTSMSPSAASHKPSFSIEYRLDSDRRFIRNSIEGKESFSNYRLPVITGTNSLSQVQNMKDFNISDNFNISWRNRKIKWIFDSHIQFSANPEGRIDVSGGEKPGAHLSQTSRTYSFHAIEEINGCWEYRRSRVYFPITLSFRHDRINTQLDNNGFGDEPIFADNNLAGNEFRLTFAPNYEYSSRYNRFVFRAGIPLSLSLQDYENHGSIPCIDRNTRIGFSPSLYVNYDATSRSTFGTTFNFNNSYGDILDLLTSPVMTDYLSMNLKSGIVSHSRKLNLSLRYSFKSPLTMWNFRINTGYFRSWNNLMPQQYVSSGLIAISNYLSPNSSDAFKSDFTISKRFKEIDTKATLTGSWSLSRNRIQQNGMLVKYHGSTFTVSPVLTANPLDWFELGYNLNLSFTTSHFRNIRRSFSSQTHDIRISFYPGAKWEINLKSDITRKEISEKRYKTMSLFDAGTVFKLKSLRLGLELRNILNCKEYSYTVFNGLDQFSYSYSLRGREILLSLTFIK